MTVYVLFLNLGENTEEFRSIHESMTGAELRALEFFRNAGLQEMYDDHKYRITPMELLP